MKPGDDLYTVLAEQHYKAAFRDCTDPNKRSRMRDAAKTAHFMRCYGASDTRILEVLDGAV